MSGNAFLLTRRRMEDRQYFAVAIREARDMHKPPISLNFFWKHPEKSENPEKMLEEICAWLDHDATEGDYVVLDGDEHCVEVVTAFAKDHSLIPVICVWEPEPTIRDL